MKTEINFWPGKALWLAAAVVLAGCGKHDAPAANADSFDSAAPDIKAAWTQAVAADKANDYVKAVLGYKQVLAAGTNLTDVQSSTAQQSLGLVNQRLVDASMAGDAAARAALNALAAQQRRTGNP